MIIPRVMVFDLDGTLAESRQPMSAEMADLLVQLLAKMPVAVMSGSSWLQFKHQFLPALPEGAALDRLYLFPTNAAACLVHRDGAWHPQYDHTFSAQTKQRILLALDEAIKETHFEQPKQVWGEQVEDRGGEITFSALGQDAPLEEKQKYDSNGERRRPLMAALKHLLPDLNITMSTATSIDITPHGISKAYGLNRLIELTGVPIEQMLYAGDALEEGGSDAVVLQTGIHTHAVFGPRETEALVEEMLGRLR